MSRALLALSLAIAASVAGCAAPHTEAEIDRLACNTCHARLYLDHVTPGRSRECYQCHGTSKWQPYVLDGCDHPYRISRGNHAGWDCGDCHASMDTINCLCPGAPTPMGRDVPTRMCDSSQIRAEITCTNCHAHTEERTSPIHLGMGDYSYGPSTCLECHSRERD